MAGPADTVPGDGDGYRGRARQDDRSGAAGPASHRWPTIDERTAMLNVFARARLARVLDPVGAGLLRTGLSPDAVTIAGTAGVVVASLVLVARGHLLLGTVAVTLFALTDLLDGAMARARGRATRFGAFLDSTMDRIADGAVFGALAYWLATTGQRVAAAAALACLLTGALVSYAKARAEGLGLDCAVGLAERADRLILAGIAALLQVAGVPYSLAVGLWLLAALAVVTVAQRIRWVWRQTRGDLVGDAAGGTRPA